MPNKEELASLVAANLSLEEIMDVLGWDIEELVVHLLDDIWDNKEDFMEAIE